jgi:adenosylhomocysteine nucleosidase
MRSGAGAAAAARALTVLLQGYRPAWIISAGFAGAIDQRLKRGDVVLSDSLSTTDGRKLELELSLDAGAGDWPAGVHVGRVVSAPRIVRRAKDKLALGAEHAALAVDLESFAVAEACREAGVRFLGVRAISDAAQDELPPDIDRLARQKTGAARLGAAAGAIFRRPGSFKDILKLKETAIVVSDRLAKFLSQLIAGLPREGTQAADAAAAEAAAAEPAPADPSTAPG